jgi:hypothetical protein
MYYYSHDYVNLDNGLMFLSSLFQINVEYNSLVGHFLKLCEFFSTRANVQFINQNKIPNIGLTVDKKRKKINSPQQKIFMCVRKLFKNCIKDILVKNITNEGH